MELTSREIWTVLHGMVFGAIYLLAFAGALAELYSLSPFSDTRMGISKSLQRLRVGTWTMTAIAWLTVISGTWAVYIWYRATPVPGVDLSHFPKFFLLSSTHTNDWHNFGMEWKEHIVWIVPFVMTSIAFTVQRHGDQIVRNEILRKSLMALLIISFSAGGIAALLGAFINKAAATH